MYSIICHRKVVDAMVLGRVCFHIENAGMGGMGVGLGRGTPCGKSWKMKRLYQQMSSRHHCGALLDSAGQLVAPFCLRSFLSLGGCWCLLGPKLQKNTKIERTDEPKLMPKGMYC